MGDGLLFRIAARDNAVSAFAAQKVREAINACARTNEDMSLRIARLRSGLASTGAQQ